VELSQDAFAFLTRNYQRYGLDPRTLRNENLTTAFEELASSVDLVVSNPPYIPNNERMTMSKHVLDHEPEMALFVDDVDPIIFYKEIIKLADKKLVKGGLLFFELHESFGNEVKECIQLFGFEEIEIRNDLQGKSRMLKAQKV
jgi:release factor glutamine methyltransferase